MSERLGLFDYLNRVGERREARQASLLRHGLSFRNMLLLTFQAIEAKFFVACSVIGLFAWAFAREGDKDTRNLMVGALIAAFAGAWGYYLGSSNSASMAHAQNDKALNLADRVVEEAARVAKAAPVAGGDNAAGAAAEEVADAAVEKAAEIKG